MDSIRRGCPGRPSPLWAHFGSEVWLSDAADILGPCKSREARRASLPHDSRSCSKMDADGIPPSTVCLGNTPSPAAAKGFSSPVCIPVRRGGTTTRPQSGPLRFRRRARRPTGAAARESCSWAFHWTLLEGRTHTSRGGWSRARGQPSEGGPVRQLEYPIGRSGGPRSGPEAAAPGVGEGRCGVWLRDHNGFLPLPRLRLPPPPFGERPRTSLEASLLAVQASGAVCRRPCAAHGTPLREACWLRGHASVLRLPLAAAAPRVLARPHAGRRAVTRSHRWTTRSI